MHIKHNPWEACNFLVFENTVKVTKQRFEKEQAMKSLCFQQSLEVCMHRKAKIML